MNTTRTTEILDVKSLTMSEGANTFANFANLLLLLFFFGLKIKKRLTSNEDKMKRLESRMGKLRFQDLT